MIHKEKTDTVQFKQTLSNVEFKKFYNRFKGTGIAIQDRIRELVREDNLAAKPTQKGK